MLCSIDRLNAKNTLFFHIFSINFFLASIHFSFLSYLCRRCGAMLLQFTFFILVNYFFVCSDFPFFVGASLSFLSFLFTSFPRVRISFFFHLSRPISFFSSHSIHTSRKCVETTNYVKFNRITISYYYFWESVHNSRAKICSNKRHNINFYLREHHRFGIFHLIDLTLSIDELVHNQNFYFIEYYLG